MTYSIGFNPVKSCSPSFNALVEEHDQSMGIAKSSAHIYIIRYSLFLFIISCNLAKASLLLIQWVEESRLGLHTIRRLLLHGSIRLHRWQSLLVGLEAEDVGEKGISTADVVAQAKDDRALFYMGIGGCSDKVRTLTPGDAITGPLNGASFVKWTNLHADGTAQHHQKFSDTDFPVFRLAEIYLTRAEAKYRLNGSQDGLEDILKVQDRANRQIKASSVDEQTLIDEWCREFYMEGRRRSDLVRFGLFTGSKYLWSFKGGSENGQGIPAKCDIYPIPGDEIKNNPNMTQNPKY